MSTKKPKLTLPKRIKISGLAYSVKEVSHLTRGKAYADTESPDDKLLGVFIEKQMEILVERDQKETMKKLTLMHEIIHGMLAYTSFRNTKEEEDVCICLEQQFFQFIRDNPEVIRYLQEK